VDRWFVYDFLFPGTLLMSSGGKPAGQPDPDPANSVLLHSCQTLTPETDGTTHYFFQQSHRADAGDASVTEGIYQSLVTAFNEDRDMITAQYAAIRRDPGAAMLPLAIDAALVRYRRLLEEAIAAER
jgi:vanillate O-demethylase monooxygenase subunit